MEIAHSSNHDKLQTFQFGELTLRALLVEGEPWFVLRDLTEALGIARGARVAERLREKGVRKTYIRSGGQNREVTIIDEGNLYRVIMRSNSPVAERFESWVTDEVLPAIRKTGSYQVQKNDDALVFQAFQILQARKEQAEAELAIAKPKAEVYDKVLTTEHTFGFRDLCKSLRAIFPVTEADVKRVLRDKRILTAGFRLDVYSGAIDRGFAVRRPVGRWGGKERFQVRFTQKTVEMLLDELEPLEEVA